MCMSTMSSPFAFNKFREITPYVDSLGGSSLVVNLFAIITLFLYLVNKRTYKFLVFNSLRGPTRKQH